jgi:prophage regulatory protein
MNTEIKYRFQRRPEWLFDLGLGRSTADSRVKEGTINPPVNLGGRAVGFLEHETQAVIKALAAGYSKEQMKNLVAKLVTSRKSIAEMVGGTK